MSGMKIGWKREKELKCLKYKKNKNVAAKKCEITKYLWMDYED